MSVKYDRQKHLWIKKRLVSLYENHLEQIEKGEFLRMSTVVIEEMQWLSDQLERLVGKQFTDDEPIMGRVGSVAAAPAAG